jgi:diamine N-acetyltransferase
MTITLREVTRENWYAIARLKLHDGQDQFVAPNWYSMLEALFSDGTLHSRAIYLDDSLIGYAMYGIDPDTQECWIVRLMVEKDQQGKGHGRSAMTLVIDQLRQLYACKEIFINFVPTNANARKLYTSLGFQDTGKVDDGELVFRLPLDG